MTKLTEKQSLIVLALLLFMAVAGALFFIYKFKISGYSAVSNENVANTTSISMPDTVQSTTSDKLFLSRTEVDRNGQQTLNITLHDINVNKTLLSKKLRIVDSLIGAGSTSSSGSNDGVQYDPERNEVFYMTDGTDAMGGESCHNDDGSCFVRIHRVNLATGKTDRLYQTDEYTDHWIVNPTDHSIYLSYGKQEGNHTRQNIKKLDYTTGIIQDLVREDFTKLAGPTELVLSADKKSIYQASQWYEDPGPRNLDLKIIHIDLVKKTLKVIDIYQGDSGDFESDISPDDKYFSFYGDKFLDGNLYIHNIKNKSAVKIVPNGRISNFNLTWSGDSKKLFYSWNKQLGYYDVDTGKLVTLTTPQEREPFALGATLSGKHLLYATQNLVVREIDTGQTYILPEAFPTAGDISSISGFATY